MFSAVFYGAEIPDSVVTVAIGLTLAVTSAGIGLMAWTLTTVVKLTQMVGVLQEKVARLVGDIDDLVVEIDELRDGNPEVRRYETRRHIR